MCLIWHIKMKLKLAWCVCVDCRVCVVCECVLRMFYNIVVLFSMHRTICACCVSYRLYRETPAAESI